MYSKNKINDEGAKQLIGIFETLCSPNISTYDQRKYAVERQMQRNIWEFEYMDQKIRIEKGFEDFSYIEIIKNHPTVREERYSITHEEYFRLEKLYQGDFKEDLIFKELCNDAWNKKLSQENS